MRKSQQKSIIVEKKPLQGFLQKQGATNKVLTVGGKFGWKLRWFVYDHNTNRLYYYKQEQPSSSATTATPTPTTTAVDSHAGALGFIDIEKAVNIFVPSPSSSSSSSSSPSSPRTSASTTADNNTNNSNNSASAPNTSKTEFCIESRVGEGGRIYRLAAKDQEERDWWLSELTRVWKSCRNPNYHLQHHSVINEEDEQEVLSVSALSDMLGSGDFDKQMTAMKNIQKILRTEVNLDIMNMMLGTSAKYKDSNNSTNNNNNNNNSSKGNNSNNSNNSSDIDTCSIDPAVQREISVAISRSKLVDMKAPFSTEIERTLENSLKLLLQFVGTKNTETQVTALNAFNYVISKNDELKRKAFDLKLPNQLWKILGKSVNIATQRKVLQSLEHFSYLSRKSNQCSEFFGKKYLKDIVQYLKDQKGDEGISLAVLGTLANLSPVAAMHPLIGTKSNFKILFEFLSTNYSNEIYRELIQTILVNLAQTESVRMKMFYGSDLSIQNFVNSALPHKERYYYSKLLKAWASPDSVGTTVPTLSSITGTRKSESAVTWAETLRLMVNEVVEEVLREENLGVKIEILEIEFPREATAASALPPAFRAKNSDSSNENSSEISTLPPIMITPWVTEDDNEARAAVEIRPNFYVKVSAAKGPISIKTRMSNTSVQAKVAVGFVPKRVEPVWISFLEMPKIQFKVDVEKIDVSSLLKKIVEKVIKDSFLYPKRFYLEVSPPHVPPPPTAQVASKAEKQK